MLKKINYKQMKKFIIFLMVPIFIACTGGKSASPSKDDFAYQVDTFADIKILRYRVAGFEDLSLKQKELIYYLSQAALEGRDILWDQNNKYNLAVRRTLEAIYENSENKLSDDFKKLETYLKRIWMANGIHHHYSEDKMIPGFSAEYFAAEVKKADPAKLPLKEGETPDDLIAVLTPILFDPDVMPIRSNQAAGVDLITTSANNYYEGVTQKEAEDFYAKMKNPDDNTPISYGLNSKLVKENGQIVEKVYKINGMYSAAIERIVGWLEKAVNVAENEEQKDIIRTLIRFYNSGDLKTFDEFNIKWVQDLTSQVDFVNGFTETYGDPLGMKASWESLINFKDIEATKRTEIISNNAQWFEYNSPIDKDFKKEEVKGVSAKVITAAMLGGDCYPATPIGINLPNANWIRLHFGSKSVTIQNITEAYDQSSMGSGFNEEFMWSDEERDRAKKYGSLTNNLHVDLHECLGHGSGKLLPGVDPDALKAYGSPIEETRADLFALYYLGDPKMVELGLLPDEEAYKAQYYHYLMNGFMTQLTRIQPGKNIEQAHMRNRQTIAAWVYDFGKDENVVELKEKDGKKYIVINDYKKLRDLFGLLLNKVQRIKSTGNFEGARDLVEKYGVKVDQEMHKEILDRYAKLNIAPYSGFVNPVYSLVTDKKGNVKDVNIAYDEDYIQQHLRYSKEYSVLPTYN
jgi:dipeptidyl-peptidase-3